MIARGGTGPGPRAVAAALVCLVWLAAGCDGGTSSPERPPTPVMNVREMTVRATPTPVDLDGRPGPDGLAVLVNLFGAQGDQPTTVRGRLEFALYEGLLEAGDFGQARPLRSWSFAGEELEPFLMRDLFGWGYRLPLAWGESPPRTSAATLTASYVPPSGRAVSAKPLGIALRPR